MEYYGRVYLIVSQKRFVITEKSINNKDYALCLEVSSVSMEITNRLCRAYCAGYISVNTIGIKVINDISEFA